MGAEATARAREIVQEAEAAVRVHPRFRRARLSAAVGEDSPPWRAVSEEDAVQTTVELTERLFAQCDEVKDVEIIARGGSLRAHSCVLGAASEAFEGVLSGGQERMTKRLEIADMSVTTLQVFLRLLYTGHVEEKDWGGNAGDQVPLVHLLEVLAVAKRYMVHNVLSMTVEVL